MEIEKPAIVIALKNKNDDLTELAPLLNGIEEEEIPVITKIFAINNSVQRSYQAALSSHLSVGIGFDEDVVIVHYQNLHEDQPLFVVNKSDQVNLRTLGANAARLVKGVPFKEIR